MQSVSVTSVQGLPHFIPRFLLCPLKKLLWKGYTYDRLGNGLSDGVDLRCVSTTGNSYSDINASCNILLVFVLFPKISLHAHTEFVETEDEERLINLESEDFWLNEGEGLSVNLDKAFASLRVICEFLPLLIHSLGDVYLAVSDSFWRDVSDCLAASFCPLNAYLSRSSSCRTTRIISIS
jgi:hypothetical protein